MWEGGRPALRGQNSLSPTLTPGRASEGLCPLWVAGGLLSAGAPSWGPHGDRPPGVLRPPGSGPRENRAVPTSPPAQHGVWLQWGDSPSGSWGPGQRSPSLGAGASRTPRAESGPPGLLGACLC